jgi:O-antigen/teichoic acid export membrane protein
MASVIPLAMVAGLDILVTQTDVIMIGIFRTAEEVGVYRVAVQGAMLATIGVSAMNMIMAPYISKFASSNDSIKMENIAKQSARVSFFIALSATLVFSFFGKQLISLIFGEVYTDAYLPLLFLAIAQTIHAGVGAGGIILNMNGYERSTLIILSAAALINVVLNFIMIPIWGGIGAALATAIAIVFRKIITWYMVYIRLKIDSSILGLNFSSKHH